MTSMAVPMTGSRHLPITAATMKSTATRAAATARMDLVGITAFTSVYSAPAQRPPLFCTDE